jgi:hypothetical protein
VPSSTRCQFASRGGDTRGAVSRSRSPFLTPISFLAALLALAASIPATERSFPGLPDPGKPVKLILRAGSTDESTNPPAGLTLRGPDATLQLVATVKYSTGQLRDWTHDANYTVEPAGVVAVSRSGAVSPLADGKAAVTARGPGGLAKRLTVTVERFGKPEPVNFANEVVPIFTKAGCNSGACHGKSGGQNGFRLSLLGFEPTHDFRYLVQESRGRRLSPGAPETSLLLMKSTNALGHGGGERIKPGSADYHVLHRWMSQGMPYGGERDPRVASISVFPSKRVLPPDGSQQVLVVAHYTDGTTRDVTRAALYEPNDKEMADVDAGGRLRLLGRPGDVAVMVRYQGRVAVSRATVPVGAPVENLPTPRNYVDELAYAKFKEMGLPPSGRSDDTTFLRRVTVDVTGRLPTGEQARAFLADASADKRDRLLDQLLAGEAYADWFASKWSAILRNKRDRETFERGNYLFHEWLKTSLHANKPYDRMVRELLTATGESANAPAVAWYRQADEPAEQVEDTSQLFLGTRIQCARCHHHPYEKWGQDDYYGLAAFFSRVKRKDGAATDEFRVYHDRGPASARNPATEKDVLPTGLGDARAVSLGDDDDPRRALADWMTGPAGSRLFARSLVNRYWKHFFGRGIVDPEDDMRETNPPSNPALLDALADDFIKSGYDLKALVRTICQSNLYQLSAQPNAFNEADRQSFSRYYTRRLSAEVLLDAIDGLNGSSSTFDGLPQGGRAVQMRDHRDDLYFLKVFGRPMGASVCECERAGDVSLAQSLHLLNSGDLYDRIANGRARQLASPNDQRPDVEKVTELYYDAFARPPAARELAAATAYLAKAEPDKKQAAYEDLLWALINTKEFLFNR